MNTKKILVAYDKSKPNNGKGDFLAVVFEAAKPVFLGLKSHRIYSSGRVVFVGREITEKDVFARLVDSGRKIENVDHALGVLGRYLGQLQSFKIGDVLTILPDNVEPGFRLEQIAEMSKIGVKKLPLP
jgi:hypothetical protein